MLVKLTLGGNTLEGPHTLKPELTTTSQQQSPVHNNHFEINYSLTNNNHLPITNTSHSYPYLICLLCLLFHLRLKTGFYCIFLLDFLQSFFSDFFVIGIFQSLLFLFVARDKVQVSNKARNGNKVQSICCCYNGSSNIFINQLLSVFLKLYLYKMFHQFRQTKFALGGSIFSSSKLTRK